MSGLGRPASAQEPTGQHPRQLDRLVRVQMPYLLYLPPNYAEKPVWPLVLFLHGSQERGRDIELVKRHGPPKLVAAGREFPFILLTPQCPPDRWWDAAELSALLDEVCETHHVDLDCISATGLSMGGFGVWSLAYYEPARFAALAPICGGGEPYWVKSLAHLPVWAFHGARDAGVSVRRSQSMIDGLRRAGGDPKLTIYPDAGHDVWTETYENPELYTWLLSQRRRPVN